MHFQALLQRDDQYPSFRALYQPLQQCMIQPQSKICSVSHWGQYDQPLTVDYIIGVFVWSHGFLRNYVTIRMAGKDNGRKSCPLKTWQLVPYFQHFCTFSQYFTLFCQGNCKTSPINCGFPDFDPVILVGMSSGRHNGTWPQSFSFPGSLISEELDTFLTVRTSEHLEKYLNVLMCSGFPRLMEMQFSQQR